MRYSELIPFRQQSLEQTILRGNSYAYLKSNRWDGKRYVTHRVYLGRSEKALKALHEILNKRLTGESELGVAGECVLKDISNSLNFGRILRGYIADPKLAVLAEHLIILRTLYPESKLGIMERHLPKSILKYHTPVRYMEESYKVMDLLYHRLEDITYDLTCNVVKKHRLDLDCIIIDASPFQMYKDEESGLIRFGYRPKKHRNLPQANMLLAVNREYVPLMSRVFPGNTPDVEMLNRFLDILDRRKLFKKAQRILVFDEGCVNKENIKKAESAGFLFVSVLRTNSMGRFLKDRKRLKKVYTGEDSEVYAYPLKGKVYGKKRNILVCFSPIVAREKRQGLLEKIEKVRKEAESQNRLRSEGEEKLNAVGNLIADYNLKRAIKPRIEGDKVVLKVDDEEVKKRKRRCGYFILFSNKMDLSPKEMVAVYKSRDVVEKAFEAIKGLLSPKIFHSKDERIETHLTMLDYAFTLISILKLILSKSGTKMSYEALMRGLRNGRAIEGCYSLKLEKSTKRLYVFRFIRPSEETAKILDAINLTIPTFNVVEVEEEVTPVFSKTNTDE